MLAAVQQLTPLADEAGLSMAQLAVAWVLQNPNVSAAIIGASRPEQVTENAKAAGVKLDPAVLAAIDDVLESVIRRDPALTTMHCMPTGRDSYISLTPDDTACDNHEGDANDDEQADELDFRIGRGDLHVQDPSREQVG